MQFIQSVHPKQDEWLDGQPLTFRHRLQLALAVIAIIVGYVIVAVLEGAALSQ